MHRDASRAADATGDFVPRLLDIVISGRERGEGGEREREDHFRDCQRGERDTLETHQI